MQHVAHRQSDRIRQLESELLDMTEIASHARAKNSTMRIALEAVDHYATLIGGDGPEKQYAIPARALKLVEAALKG